MGTASVSEIAGHQQAACMFPCVFVCLCARQAEKGGGMQQSKKRKEGREEGSRETCKMLEIFFKASQSCGNSRADLFLSRVSLLLSLLTQRLTRNLRAAIKAELVAQLTCVNSEFTACFGWRELFDSSRDKISESIKLRLFQIYEGIKNSSLQSCSHSAVIVYPQNPNKAVGKQFSCSVHHVSEPER